MAAQHNIIIWSDAGTACKLFHTFHLCWIFNISLSSSTLYRRSKYSFTTAGFQAWLDFPQMYQNFEGQAGGAAV